MKKELLAPAGNMECLKAAIHNGCDAIYLSGKLFGARKYAPNFSNEELEEATHYAHIYGVKIYVTVNTIIYEDEIEDCLNYLCFLYNIGVDAVIVQDIGLIALIRKYLPNLEIHASTQAHTHNIEQLKLLEKLGVKRVVLARELPLSFINSLDTNLELEIFIHGALCISYSGQCLFSSFVLNRSGNRGECAGLCRTPFNLLEENKEIIHDKYLLSPKEFNTTNYVEELKKSKACSLKIEGRMKSPEYVGYVTSIYRKLLDNDNYKLSKEEIFNLKSLYNRGFTKGYLFDTSDEDFISLYSSNHQGVEIGKVVEVNKDKIKIYLIHDLNQGDAIRLPNNEGMYVNFLYNEKNLLVNKGLKNSYVYIDNKVNLKTLGLVLLTINNKLTLELNKINKKKININSKVKARCGEKLVVSYSDGINEVIKKGNIVESAKSSPITSVRIKEILSKLGNTPYQINNIDLDIDDNIFIPVGYLNEIRRDLINDLTNKRKGTKRNYKLDFKYKDNDRKVSDFKISALARCEEQVLILIKENVDYIYVTDTHLYNKYKNQVYLRLDRVNNDFLDYKNERLLIGEIGSLKYINTNEVVTDYYLNVVNSSYINYLKDLGVKRITLSPELNFDRLKLLTKHVKDLELEFIIYGRLEYMIMKYKMKDVMKFKDNLNYSLEDKSGRIYPIVSDNYTHIFGHNTINLIDMIPEFKKQGINVFRLELFDEDSEEIIKLIQMIRKNIN